VSAEGGKVEQTFNMDFCCVIYLTMEVNVIRVNTRCKNSIVFKRISPIDGKLYGKSSGLI